MSSNRTSLNDAQVSAVVRIVNVAGALLVIVPLLNLVNLYPLTPSSSSWRFGAFGVTANNLLLPTVGLALLTGAAAWTSGRRRLWLIAILTAFSAVAILGALSLFSLDALEERARVVQLEARGVVQNTGVMNFQLNVAKAALQAVVAAVGCGVISYSAWRGAQRAAVRKAARKGPDPSMVVAGTSTAGGAG